jgi:hypothetical protein
MWPPNINSFCFHNGVSPFPLGVDQLGIERPKHAFDDSFQMIGKNLKQNVFSRHKHLW